MATRFLADAMLGSLARKLRAFGFDTEYRRDGQDSSLLAAAKKEGRILLTADVALAARAGRSGTQAFLLRGRRDGDRVREISALAAKEGVALQPGPPVCSECNALLRQVAKKDVLGLVPEGVSSRHRLFLVCSACGKVYWRGGHWKKLSRMRLSLKAGAGS